MISAKIPRERKIFPGPRGGERERERESSRVHIFPRTRRCRCHVRLTRRAASGLLSLSMILSFSLSRSRFRIYARHTGVMYTNSERRGRIFLYVRALIAAEQSYSRDDDDDDFAP